MKIEPTEELALVRQALVDALEQPGWEDRGELAAFDALADAYLALLDAAQAAEEMLNAAEMEATHGVTASPAFVDRQVIFARDRLRAAVSVGSPETRGTE